MIVVRHTIAKEEWEKHELNSKCKCSPDVFRQKIGTTSETVFMHNLLESHSKPCEYHTHTFSEDGVILDNETLMPV